MQNFGSEVDLDTFSAIKIKVKDYDLVGGDDRLGDILLPMEEIREAALSAADGECVESNRPLCPT